MHRHAVLVKYRGPPPKLRRYLVADAGDDGFQVERFAATLR